MKRIFNKAFVMTLLLAVGIPALGSPVVLSESEFSDADAIVDFDGIANGRVINDQFSASSVSFSGSLFGLNNPGDTKLFNGSTILHPTGSTGRVPEFRG